MWVIGTGGSTGRSSDLTCILKDIVSLLDPMLFIDENTFELKQIR